MTNLPEPVRPRRPAVTPDLIKAAVSPTAAALTAAGAGIGVLDHSVVLVIVLAAVGWSGRMAAALIARSRRRRAERPRPPELDPWSVPEPWRQLVEQAASARIRFDQVINSWPAGPTRDELRTLQPLVWEHVGQVGILAQRGAAADGWNGATFVPGRPRAADLRDELGHIQREKLRFAGTARAADAERREAALAAELRDVRRQEELSQGVRDRLRAAVVRLEATVVELVTVEPPGSGRSAAGAGGVATALDELSDRLSSLRVALTETTGPPPGSDSTA